MLQLYELCRLCAQKKRNKFDLFTSQNSEESNILLAKISICLSLQVTRDDMLPKMVCYDCQKSVEQFNMFRVKCHKAEERLNKMLSTVTPSKATVTQIKQEYLENDCHENSNLPVEVDSINFNEPLALLNLKPMKNVKCEIDEENKIYEDFSSDMVTTEFIQIISEEIVNPQTVNDVKQPRIEVVSENFKDNFKNMDLIEVENNDSCDVKVISEKLLTLNDGIGSQELKVDFPNSEPIHYVEIKEPIRESEEEFETYEFPDLERKKLIENSECVSSTVEVKNSLPKKKCKKKQKLNLINSEHQIDEKYLTLGDGETCNVDMEEMEAIIRKKQNVNARFDCVKCNKSFKFFKSLRKHKHWHNSQPDIFVCEICRKEKKNFEFSSLKSLNSHIQRKHMPLREINFQCQICLKNFKSQGQLNAHCKKVHNNAEASCQICGKKFKNKIRLKSHLIVHQENRPFICDQCGQSFKWSSALKVHMLWHRQEKNYLCSECGKKFTAKKNLIEHLNIHAGKRPFTCEFCSATFVQVSAYSKHLYTHNEGKKNHKCDKCEKSYSHAYMLRQHLLRHTDLRPYECSTCHCAFKSQSDLWCHSKIHQEKQYGCQVCGRKFSLSKTLRDHMVLHTGIKHLCPVPDCGKAYSQRFTLTKHFCKQHPSLSIISRKGGRKACVDEKSVFEKNSHDSNFIHYNFEEKNFVK